MREQLRESIWSRLKTVAYPGFSRDIVSFGMVRSVEVDDQGRAHIVIVYSTEPERVRQAIAQHVREAVQSIDGIRDVHIEWTPRGPVRPSTPQPRKVEGIHHVIAVASAKGGVGKSTIAVHLAYALKEIGAQVGILDADIYGPSIPTMLAHTGQPTADAQKRIHPVIAKGLKMMSIGFFLPSEDQALIWRGPMVMKAVHQLMWDVVWAPLDFLVVDLPPGTGDAQLTLLQEVQLSGAIIVTTPQKVALVDARKGVTMFRRLHTPVLGIIENMAYFRCPNCQTVVDIFDRGGGRWAAESLQVPFLGEVPIDPRMRAAADNGKTIFEVAPDAEVARVFLEIARQLVETLPSSLTTSPA